jgi:phage terminase small subunit
MAPQKKKAAPVGGNTPVKKEPTLTDKQQRFVEEYLIDLNATKAAQRAGYSEKTAMEQGYQLLQKTSVQTALAHAMEARAKRTEITADRVLQEYANIAFGNMREYAEFSQDGIFFKDSQTLSDMQMARISELSQETKEFNGAKTTTTKFKLYCKDHALVNLMKHLGLFEKDNDQKKGDVFLTIGGKSVDE